MILRTQGRWIVVQAGRVAEALNPGNIIEANSERQGEWNVAM